MKTPLDPPSQLDLQNALKAELREQQDVFYGIVGGLAAALVGAIIWAAITVATKYQIGYMAIGVGLLVGFSVRFFGSGIDKSFGVIGAACALLGCMLGNVLSQVGFVANEEGVGYFDVMSRLDIDIFIGLVVETFEGIDLFFYALAAYEGFRFSYRKIEDELTKAIAAGKVEPPQYVELRRPFAIGLFVFLVVVGFLLATMEEGVHNYKYESGKLKASGRMKYERETGPWQYWYENGQKEQEGSFDYGKPDGDWIYYNEDGTMASKGAFKAGMKEGEWIDYYPGGSVKSKGRYVSDREDGSWSFFFADGKLEQKAYYLKGTPMGEWEFFYPNGNPQVKGNYNGFSQVGLWTQWYESGAKQLEMEYINDKRRLLNMWSEKGEAQVVNGNGTQKVYDNEGHLLTIGTIKDGSNVGVWKRSYPNGNKREIGEYKDSIYYVQNAWDENGEQLITNGNGKGEGLEDGYLFSGKFENGLRAGLWQSYFTDSDKVQAELFYINGKANGLSKTYDFTSFVTIEGTRLDDERVGLWKWYSADGVIESEANFVKGKKHGSQIFYNNYGDILKIEYYKEGKLLTTNVGGFGAVPDI